MRFIPLAAAALVALATISSASATETVKKTKKMTPAVRISRIDDIYAGRSRDAFVTGAARDPGSDNRYFSDTRNPSYLVGPGWLQRFN